MALQQSHVVIGQRDNQLENPGREAGAEGIQLENEEGAEEHRKGQQRDKDFEPGLHTFSLKWPTAGTVGRLSHPASRRHT